MISSWFKDLLTKLGRAKRGKTLKGASDRLRVNATRCSVRSMFFRH